MPKIEEIDKNFKVDDRTINGRLISVPSSSLSLFGIQYSDGKGFHRLPNDLVSSLGDIYNWLNEVVAGGRVCFKTNSKFIKIHVTYPTLDILSQMALTGQAGFSLNEIKGGEETHVHTFAFSVNDKEGYSSSTDELDGEEHDYIMYFPLYNRVSTLSIEIEENATISKLNPYRDAKPILYYGSSITNGGCASRPDNTYEAFIAKWNNVDFINMGLSGNCLGQKEMAEFLSSFECSAFVLDYDYNTPSLEHLDNTHEKVFLEFRKKHPDTPVIIISAPYGKGNPDYFAKRRSIVKKTYLNAKKNGDDNVYFINGYTFFPKQIKDDCIVDKCHPNDLGFYYIAKKIAKTLKKIGL
ncbi:MAG: SGNH/GDSL hydrolase family protein [Bacilli bacterium]|nr:SGNH/GDSL hydrolase family protein [Bacilli bacterium]